ncbi:MAG: ATP-binding protein [Alphaproteobacteria bacterium]|nr:ATP-binding protein [Alphaproteobacteria bacterium]
MDIVIGDFVEASAIPDHLALTFHLDTHPVRWRQAGRTAELAASWFEARGPEVTDVISYILNELVENALKFASGGDVVVRVGFSNDAMLLGVSNRLPAQDAAALESHLRTLVSEDPMELLIRTVEANAEAQSDRGSGLGFLTMMTDYGARLAWRLRDDEADLVRLETLARLPLEGD